MPEHLIDFLVDQVPAIFDEQEEAFERDLAKTSGGLFFRRRVVPCLLLERPVDEQKLELDREIRDAQVEHMKPYGVGKGQFDAFDGRQARLDEKADLRAAAYAGWLVTNRQFLTERDDLREREGHYALTKRGPRSKLLDRRRETRNLPVFPAHWIDLTQIP